MILVPTSGTGRDQRLPDHRSLPPPFSGLGIPYKPDDTVMLHRVTFGSPRPH